jgi:hypothetical protein
MNARQRINGLLADWTAFAIEINDRGVAILRKHQNLLVCEYAGESRDKLATTVRRVSRILADIEDKGLRWLFCRIPSRVTG